MKDNNIITHITLNEDEVLVKKRLTTAQPNYIKIGNGTMNKKSIQSIDLLTEMDKMSQPARTVLLWIKDGMIWNPYDDRIEFIIKVLPETPAAKQMLVKGFKELSQKDLVRRVKRSHYMINPKAIITDYNKQLAIWDTLK